MIFLSAAFFETSLFIKIDLTSVNKIFFIKNSKLFLKEISFFKISFKILSLFINSLFLKFAVL